MGRTLGSMSFRPFLQLFAARFSSCCCSFSPVSGVSMYRAVETAGLLTLPTTRIVEGR